VKQGPAREVLQIGKQPTAEPGPGEVRVHLKTSGVNPSDWKSRSGRTAPMSAPLIIPHSDGAGDIDRVGPGVANRVGERVWVWNGQWRRPHGTAAEYIVLPSARAANSAGSKVAPSRSSIAGQRGATSVWPRSRPSSSGSRSISS